MATQFYRKKEAGKPDAFYEVGTNRYIGPTEFAKGGLVEAKQTTPPAVAPDTSAPLSENPVLKYIQENVTDPARKQFEAAQTAKAGLPNRTDLLATARQEAGVADLESTLTRSDQDIVKLNQELQDIEDGLLSGSKALEGQGRGITRSLIRGQQGKMAEQASIDKIPLSRALAATTSARALTESQLQRKDKSAMDTATARYEDAFRGYESATERANFEASLQKPMTDAAIKILQDQYAKKDVKTSVVDVGTRKLLIDQETGETIKDLGPTPASLKTTGGSGGGSGKGTTSSTIDAFGALTTTINDLNSGAMPYDQIDPALKPFIKITTKNVKEGLETVKVQTYTMIKPSQDDLKVIAGRLQPAEEVATGGALPQTPGAMPSASDFDSDIEQAKQVIARDPSLFNTVVRRLGTAYPGRSSDIINQLAPPAPSLWDRINPFN